MDANILELLKEKIDGIKADLKEDIREVKSEISSIKSDVNKLLEFKWKIAGMAIVVGIVSAAVFEVVLVIIKA